MAAEKNSIQPTTGHHDNTTEAGEGKKKKSKKSSPTRLRTVTQIHHHAFAPMLNSVPPNQV